MKLLIYILLLQTLLFATAPKPLSYVDAKAFSGLWYEIARTPNPYQKECVGSTVEYALQPDNTYKVHNRCFRGKRGGEIIAYNGTAQPAKGNSMSVIEMTYYYIFTKEYRVVYLASDYSSAVVCDKDMDKVWIMSKTPTLKKATLNKILKQLEKYMDIKRLIYER